MLSKCVRPENIVDENSQNIVIDKTNSIFTIKDYLNKDLNLKKYKLPELKAIAKQNKLFVTGTKPILIERINTHFTKSIQAVKIQRIVRGFFVRLTIKLQGPALRNRTMCVNDTDFYTLEPLSEIENSSFYSYTDSQKFTYGFDLNSLVSLQKKTNKMLNPYNREKMSNQIVKNIKSLDYLVRFTYTGIAETIEQPVVQVRPTTSVAPVPSTLINALHNVFNIMDGVPSGQIQLDNLERLNEIRAQPINTRIQGVFMEMDQLGHYTNSEWFLNLDSRRYYNFYRELYEIWRYRAQMNYMTKRNICPYEPFISVFPNRPYNELSIEQLREGTLKLIESFIYMGIDTDHRNLGAFHILSALTVVSIPARTAMPWLYDALY